MIVSECMLVVSLISVCLLVPLLGLFGLRQGVSVLLARPPALIIQLLLLNIVCNDLVNCGVEHGADEEHHQVDEERVEEEPCKAVERREPSEYKAHMLLKLAHLCC